MPRTTKNSRYVIVPLSQAESKAIKNEARKKGRTVQEMISTAIDEYLKKYGH